MENREVDKQMDGMARIFSEDNGYIWDGVEASKALYNAGYRKVDNERIIELPCKVGDKVYYYNYVDDEKINEDIVDGFIIGEKQYSRAETKRCKSLFMKDFNRSWFLNKEEAEKKLKELNYEKNDKEKCR